MTIQEIIPGRIFRFVTVEESSPSEIFANRFEVVSVSDDGLVAYRTAGTEDDPTRRPTMQFVELFEPANKT